MKVVIDCNVFISAGLGSKNCLEIIKIIDYTESITIHTSRDIIEEFVLVSKRDKFLKNQGRLFELLSTIISFSEEHENIPPSEYKIIDTKDQMYIDLCSHIECDYLVTGNIKHFLDSPYGKTNILSPSDFLAILKNP